MIAEPLSRALEATGYLTGGESAAPSVTLLDGLSSGQSSGAWMPSFRPDALWRSNPEPRAWGASATDLTVYFKFVRNPVEARPAEWQQEIWNRGFSPLLWLVCPDRIELYDGFGTPQRPADADKNRLDEFRFVEAELTRLDNAAGRLAMETGRFWEHRTVRRDTGVGERLLRDLSGLERDLVAAGLPRDDTQGLIGRSIFAKYLIDRGIVPPDHLDQVYGHTDLPAVLRDRTAAARFFDWTRDTFNGDLFPPSTSLPNPLHLDRVASFLGAEEEGGQLSLFPYRFDVIPVELISAIYEQFVHSAAADQSTRKRPAKEDDVYYTPLAAVSLVLDEVLHDATGDESVIDLTCGSGVFLVEALRRLAYIKGNGPPSRRHIQEILYNQLVGVDTSRAAVRVAAFSLYLAALELDPKPRPPSELKFKPLIGRTLLIGDAHEIEETVEGKATLKTQRELRRFDVIVGNPPWSFRGKEGTATRRSRRSDTPLPPRGESLDFVVRALDFAHEQTRFGMILSATPFFSRSRSGAKAAQHVVEELGRTTLVNLSDLSKWLFPRANMPAIALLARHREQRRDWMTLVHAPWSPTGERSHTIEIAPTNVTTLPVASWRRNAGLFKASFLGHHNDLMLLDRLGDQYRPLADRLRAVNTKLSAGLKKGNGARDARFLHGLPFAGKKRVGRFDLPGDLPMFDLDRAERPRQRQTYRAPLLLVSEFLYREQNGRPVVAVSERDDVVFSDAYFGATFPVGRSDMAHLVAGILGSALASWFHLMASSTFGLWMQRVYRADVESVPTPDLEVASKTTEGRRIVRLVRELHARMHDEADSEELDEAVFDLYALPEADRLAMRDGLYRARWQWQEGRGDSIAPAGVDDLRRYADAFLHVMDSWFSVTGRRRMQAEIYDVPAPTPLRVVRFAIEDVAPPSKVRCVSPDGPLTAVLARISERSKAPITNELVGVRELHAHARNEVSIIKPAARRHWMPVCGLDDADAVMRASALNSSGSSGT